MFLLVVLELWSNMESVGGGGGGRRGSVAVAGVVAVLLVLRGLFTQDSVGCIVGGVDQHGLEL